MNVFIDASGTFTDYHPGSISVVGALSIPDGNFPRLKKKYARTRKGHSKEDVSLLGNSSALGSGSRRNARRLRVSPKLKASPSSPSSSRRKPAKARTRSTAALS